MARDPGKVNRQSKSQAAGNSAEAEQTRRQEKAAATRAAILEAALDEFAARGFAAARLDDVARRAGVAKGTIYVHFRDKETLFEELVRSALGPFVNRLQQEAPNLDVPLRALATQLMDMFVREIYGTRRRDVLRLVMTEGERFPQLAQIYYREVIQGALAALRLAARRAIERGEIKNDALLRYPQLLVAPGLLAILWQGLFARFEPLDVPKLMRAHLDLLFSALERDEP